MAQITIKNKTMVNLNEILSKFDNGFDLYNENAMFNKCVNLLSRGTDVYKLLEHVIVTSSKANQELQDIISSGKITQEIIVKKEVFD